jgi:phosphate transport system permease protein
MTSNIVLVAILAMGLVGWFAARSKAQLLYTGRGSMRALPGYHGWHMALWILVPALLTWVIWQAVMPGLVESAVLAQPIAAKLPAMDMERNAILSEAWALARDPGAAAFNPLANEFAGPLRDAQFRFAVMGGVLALVLAFAGGAYGFTRVRAGFPARAMTERVVMFVLLLASLIAILTTAGIVASLLYETGVFFSQISPIDFLFGLHWAPRMHLSARISARCRCSGGRSSSARLSR